MLYIGLTLLNGLAIAVRKLSLFYHRAYAPNQAFAHGPFLIAQDLKAACPHLGPGNSRLNGDRGSMAGRQLRAIADCRAGCESLPIAGRQVPHGASGAELIR